MEARDRFVLSQTNLMRFPTVFRQPLNTGHALPLPVAHGEEQHGPEVALHGHNTNTNTNDNDNKWFSNTIINTINGNSNTNITNKKHNNNDNDITMIIMMTTTTTMMIIIYSLC